MSNINSTNKLAIIMTMIYNMILGITCISSSIILIIKDKIEWFWVPVVLWFLMFTECHTRE